MAHSVVTVTDAMLNDSLLLLVGEDGTVTPDRETVETYLNSKPGSTNIRLMHINKTDKKGIDISVDHLTYVPDVINEVEVSLGLPKEASEMDEIARNLHSFRLDHDYTTLSSPPQPEEPPELEDLVETLEEKKSETFKDDEIVKDTLESSIGDEEKDSPPQTTVVKLSEDTVPPKGRAKTQTISKVSTPKPKLKEKPKIVQQIEEEFEDDYNSEDSEIDDEDYDFDDDENDSDFEISEASKSRNSKRTQPQRIQSKKSQSQVKNDVKQVKVELNKSREQKNKIVTKEKVQDKIEKVQETPEKDKVTVPDKKAQKKEKKPPKPIPNDFMLFSTPDIIRRVGKDGQPPEASPTEVPAKITSENRSKSSTMEQPQQNSNKSNRLSLDGKTSEKYTGRSDVKDKGRRSSADKSRKNSVDDKSKVTVVDSKEDSPRKPLVLQNIKLNSREQLALEPMPTPEDIRSIIMTEDVKSYTTSTLPLVQTSEITSTEAIDQNISLDASSLDIDQSILDNINSDEISEDILYQVAQSLVGNTDLQNAIDKGINEGNLILDPAMQESIGSQSQATHNEDDEPPQSDIIKKGTQIVRPDGRIVVIPPIERPATRSRNKKKVDEPQAPKTPIKPLDEEHVSGNELDTSEGEDNQEDESEDDPNKLWCICNQPHNNRFMICCDTCEEWYHGKCVNITKAMGQQMEEEGKEWICLFCKDPSLKRPQAAARRIRKASRASTDSAESVNKSAKKASSSAQVTCIVCHKPARESSIYCSQSCILAHASGVERVVVFEKSSGRLLSGSRAPSSANLEQWLKEHPSFEVYRPGGKIVTSKQMQRKQPQSPGLTQSKLRIVKNVENQGVSLELQRKGLKVGVLKHLPKRDDSPKNERNEVKPSPTKPPVKTEPQTQKPTAKTASQPGTKKPEVTPSKTTAPVTPTNKPPKLVQTTLKSTPTTPKEKSQTPKTPKSRQPEQQTTPQSNPKQQENIRENVQKTLFEQLTNRIKLDGNIKLTEDEIKEISNEIESQLHKCFGDTGQKYRNKYRSLIFNIKDMKNQTLWKRICEKTINAYQLVRLSPDDLASQELALWREREAKHSLDMIKKSELELLNCSRQYVLKTHKGEQVVDEENRPKDKVDNTEVIRTLTEEHSSDGKDSKSDGGKDSQKKNSKHGHRDKDRDKDRRSSKDRSSSKDHKKRRRSSSRDGDRSNDRDKSRRSSSSKERISSGKKDKKRSRSKDRHRRSSHKSSRHKRDTSHISSTDKLDKKSKEILEQLVDNKIVPPLEDRLWKHVPQDDVFPEPAESDSDHEPSSTVTIPTPPHNLEGDDQGSQSSENKNVKPPELKEPEVERSMSPPLPKQQSDEIWRGTISMIDVAQITITAHEVSGDCTDLGEQLPPNLEIVGRISLDTVWDYIGKMKCSNSKIISLVRLTAVNVLEAMPYLALYSYLSSRKRLGVVKSTNRAIKDFYVLPLAQQKPIPQALLPINGPGFEESRPPLLLGIIVRDRRKRGLMLDSTPSYSSHTSSKKSRVSTPPLIVGTPPISVETPVLTEPPRSYTPPSTVSTPPLPPISKDPRVKIAVPPSPPLKEMDDGDEPYSPEDSDPDTSVPVGPPPALVAKPVVTPFYAPSVSLPTIPGLDVGPPTLPASTLEIQKQMEELNKKIEAQKSEIHSISKNIVSASTEIGQSALANIALPSNLQQILDSIKTISNEGGVEESRVESKVVADPSLTIPLILPKHFSRPPPPPPPPIPPSADFPSNTIPLNLPNKNKLKISSTNSPRGNDSPGGLLSSLSEEELMKKAAEMLGETELVKEKPKVPVTTLPIPFQTMDNPVSFPNKRVGKLDSDQSFDIEPPIPGVDN